MNAFKSQNRNKKSKNLFIKSKNTTMENHFKTKTTKEVKGMQSRIL